MAAKCYDYYNNFEDYVELKKEDSSKLLSDAEFPSFNSAKTGKKDLNEYDTMNSIKGYSGMNGNIVESGANATNGTNSLGFTSSPKEKKPSPFLFCDENNCRIVNDGNHSDLHTNVFYEGLNLKNSFHHKKKKHNKIRVYFSYSGRNHIQRKEQNEEKENAILLVTIYNIKYPLSIDLLFTVFTKYATIKKVIRNPLLLSAFSRL